MKLQYNKITLSNFRLLNRLQRQKKDNIKLTLISGTVGIDINKHTFDGLEINRGTIKELFMMYGLDTNKWEYYTNEMGSLLL